MTKRFRIFCQTKQWSKWSASLAEKCWLDLNNESLQFFAITFLASLFGSNIANFEIFKLSFALRIVAKVPNFRVRENLLGQHDFIDFSQKNEFFSDFLEQLIWLTCIKKVQLGSRALKANALIQAVFKLLLALM